MGVAVESAVGGALAAGGLGGLSTAAARQFAGQPNTSQGAPSGEKVAASSFEHVQTMSASCDPAQLQHSKQGGRQALG